MSTCSCFTLVAPSDRGTLWPLLQQSNPSVWSGGHIIRPATCLPPRPCQAELPFLPGLCLALERSLLAHIPFSKALAPSQQPCHPCPCAFCCRLLSWGALPPASMGWGAIKGKQGHWWLGGPPSAPLLSKGLLHWSSRVHASHQALGVWGLKMGWE